MNFFISNLSAVFCVPLCSANYWFPFCCLSKLWWWKPELFEKQFLRLLYHFYLESGQIHPVSYLSRHEPYRTSYENTKLLKEHTNLWLRFFLLIFICFIYTSLNDTLSCNFVLLYRIYIIRRLQFFWTQIISNLIIHHIFALRIS